MKPFWKRHISERDLTALADGAVGTPGQESHLVACPRCAERLAAHRRIGRALAAEWVNTTVALLHATRTAPRAALAFPVVALAAVLVAGALLLREVTFATKHKPCDGHKTVSGSLYPHPSVSSDFAP